MGYFLAGVGVLALAVFVVRFVLNSDPAMVAGVLRRALVVLGVVAGAAFLLAGRPPLGLALIGAALVFGHWARPRPKAGPALDRPNVEILPPPGDLSRQEALELLGLPDEADRDAIIAAHDRLVNAEDAEGWGGSWRIARLNQAKARLLGPQA